MASSAHAGGNGDDRATHQAADNARQGALHAGDGDDHLCLGKFLGMREQTVQTGDTHVVEAVDLVAIELGRQCRLFGDGQVARTGAGDDDAPVAGGGGLAAHEGELGVRDISQVDAVAEKLSGARGFFGIQARDQDALLAGIAQRFDNGGNLLGGFAGTVDNLAGSLAHPARKIELRKTQIGGWRRLDAREGVGRGDCSAGNIAQQLLKISLIHICSLRRRKV